VDTQARLSAGGARKPGRRVYAQPSRQIRIDKFDYANPEGLQETYELGFSDGKAWAKDL
jgi:hypothetical protein